MKVIFIGILAMLLLAATVSATSIAYDFTIVGNKAVVAKTITLDEPTSGKYSFALPDDAGGISTYVDDILVPYTEPLLLKDAQRLKITYTTKTYLDNANFVFDLHADFDLDTLDLQLVLPEEAVLKNKIEGKHSTSIFPDADVITTDGKSIVLQWHLSQVPQEKNISFFVRYKEQKTYWIELGIIILTIGFAVFIVKRKQAAISGQDDAAHEMNTIGTLNEKSGYERHLKETEEQVVNVLKLKEGSCEQGTLRIATGFSKANLSRILTELEQRKIIHKEKRGKKNMVFLKEA